jgi:hypothetical protein
VSNNTLSWEMLGKTERFHTSLTFMAEKPCKHNIFDIQRKKTQYLWCPSLTAFWLDQIPRNQKGGIK